MDIKLTKTKLSKMIQSGGILRRLLGPLLTIGLLLIRNVIKPLAKTVLIPLGLTTAVSAADEGIYEKISGWRHKNTRTLIISNDEMEDNIKIVKYLDSSLLLKGVSETVQNEAKEQKEGFLSMLLGTLGASLLGNIWTGRGVIAKSRGKGAMAKSVSEETKSKRQVRGINRPGEGFA